VDGLCGPLNGVTGLSGGGPKKTLMSPRGW
jgi:hypothetical protein